MRCWTCGECVSNYQYTCDFCQGLSQLKSWRRALEFQGGEYLDAVAHLAKIQREATLSLNTLTEPEAHRVASAIEWGFEDIRWTIQLQTQNLRDIDQAFKSPAQTQANEWRELAEELRRRGVLSESEQFFLKAVQVNLLDYRIYMGLAITYLECGQFENARSFLEKSLRHAPTDEERSFSHRLIGHIDECAENYPQAATALRSAIELTPTFADAHYAYARCCTRTENIRDGLSSLQKGILANTLFWYLAQYDRGFIRVRAEVKELLVELDKEVSRATQEVMAYSEIAMEEAAQAIKVTTRARDESRSMTNMDSPSLYEQAKWNLDMAKQKIGAGDFPAFLDGKVPAERAGALAAQAKLNAQSELQYYQKRRGEIVKEAWRRVPRMLALWAAIFAPLGGVAGAVFLGALQMGAFDVAAREGFIIGVPIGLGVGVLYGIKRAFGRSY